MVKLIRESINFERTGNIKSSLGLGYAAKTKKFFDNLGISDNQYDIKSNGDTIFYNNLDLQNTIITELPNNLKVKGYLDLENSNISNLPNGLVVEGILYLEYTSITELPDDIIIKGVIYLNSKQTELMKFIQNSKFKDKIKKWEI